jgi:Spy/CpxP family protein refolding chaperone
MKNIFTRVSLLTGLTAVLSIAAFAQTAAPQNDGQGEGRGGRHGRMNREGWMGAGRGIMGGRVLRRLNLSDAQRNQLREIEARYGRNLRAQRVEMRQLIELREQGATLTPEQSQRAQQLRGELRDNTEKMRAEMLALLTPEQREQLKQMREEGEARRKERREAYGRTPGDQ